MPTLNQLNESYGKETRLSAIRKWLSARGAEVLEPTNEWEVLRFKDGNGTHIIYRRKNGNLTLNGDTEKLWDAFHGRSKWTPKRLKKRTRQRKLTPQIQAMIKRDGSDCFYCGKPLEDDLTVEHLVSRNVGGPNHITNLVLAHQQHNLEAGHLSVIEKIQLRERLRKANSLT